jgi:DNA-binding transcriptional MerR regulator
MTKIIFFLTSKELIGSHTDLLIHSLYYNQQFTPVALAHLTTKTLHLHMPYKENEISKMYYTMGEVSAMFGVNQSLIRFYEKEFNVLQPKKNKKGNRYFTPEDLENLKIIFHLINDKGYTIQGAKDHIKNNMGDTRDNQRVIDSLENMKKFLLEVRDQL